MLGPMVNPAAPNKQLVGVFSLELARLYAYLYQQTGKKFAILHALDGYDEISLTGPFKMISNDGEQVLHPADLGLEVHPATAIAGGSTIEQSAAVFLKVLKGEGTKAQEEVVLANAGAALTCGKGVSFPEGIDQAKESLRSGKAYETFRKLTGHKSGSSVSMQS